MNSPTRSRRINPIKDKVGSQVDLYMLSKAGKLSYIQGSIQREFHEWHEDHELDCILLGIDEDEVLVTDWEYKDK